MVETDKAAQFKVTAIVGNREQVVILTPGATIKDVFGLLNADVKRTVPVIRGRVAHWLTTIVPDAVVRFV